MGDAFKDIERQFEIRRVHDVMWKWSIAVAAFGLGFASCSLLVVIASMVR